MKIVKKNYLDEISIKRFIEANILNAIDNKIIPEEFTNLIFSVTEVEKEYIILLESKDQSISIGCHISTEAEDYICHLRMMMGATMKLMQDLKDAKEVKTTGGKPVLKVIRGNL